MKKIRDIVTKNLSDKAILSLLLISAKFENKFNIVFENLIKTKQERWDEYKASCAEKMGELSEYFGGARSLVKVE
jgi:WASH complex subunit strumpellin